jgi:tRNA (guanine10-N2)-methyltransferase
VAVTLEIASRRGRPTHAVVPMPSQQYLIVFAQAHENFRVPELLSIAELYGFPLSIDNGLDPSRPFGVLVLEQEEHVRLLARRCILIK